MKKLIFNILLALLLPLAAGAQQTAPALLDSLTLDTMPAFTSLAEALKQPDKVVKLVLRKQKLDSFPQAIFQFKNLQYLDLSRNNIHEIPDSIGTLKNLQVLQLSRNKIEYIPRTIGDLSQLRILNINQNELYVIPPQIGKLKKLEVLDLWSNNITVFPDELKDISGNLKVLDLRTILINRETQDRVKAMLPHTKVYFSPPCKCNG
ncbi:MAG: leucine-rich repeat domain-containing protein [Bacteroidia bacterium]|jgi:Leucine-rich repeat (LRR) protein|nr:leucine-rich repeat domain-containing protein [Bacteroidia bacterium]